jgi:hypothetical protein
MVRTGHGLQGRKGMDLHSLQSNTFPDLNPVLQGRIWTILKQLQRKKLSNHDVKHSQR